MKKLVCNASLFFISLLFFHFSEANPIIRASVGVSGYADNPTSFEFSSEFKVSRSTNIGLSLVDLGTGRSPAFPPLGSEIELSVKGLSVYAKRAHVFSDNYSLFGKVGLLASVAKFGYRSSNPAVRSSFDDSENSIDVTFGFGITWFQSRKISIDLGYDYFYIDGGGTDNINLGLSWKLDGGI